MDKKDMFRDVSPAELQSVEGGRSWLGALFAGFGALVGAAIGFGFGGPLGAGIGAALGSGIGAVIRYG